MADTNLDFTIATLGARHIASPMTGVRFTDEGESVLYHVSFEDVKPWIDRGVHPPAMETAGPRRSLFFDPSKLACGIVT